MTRSNTTSASTKATTHMYSAANNPISPDSATVNIHPRARLNPPSKFGQYISGDYIPFIITNTADEEWIVYGQDEFDFETINRTHPSKEDAIEFAGEKYNEKDFKYKYAVVVRDDTITDIYHGKRWMEYRVIQSNVDGWVHGLHGDTESEKGGTKKEAIEAAKERVVEQGYNRLLIEDRNAKIVDIWPNCFLAMPESPNQNSLSPR